MKRIVYIALSLTALFFAEHITAQPFYQINPGSFHTPVRNSLPDTQTTIGHRIIVGKDDRAIGANLNVYWVPGLQESSPYKSCPDINYDMRAIGGIDTGYFDFKFNPPVYHVKSVFTYFGTQYFNWTTPPFTIYDTLKVYVNGVSYPLTSANFSENTSFCFLEQGGLNDSAFIDATGRMVGTTTPSVGWVPAIDINSTTPIDSVRMVILPFTGLPSGQYLASIFTYSFYFADTGTFINKPFIDTALCRGDSLYLHYTVYAPHYSTNVFTAQISNASGSFASPTTYRYAKQQAKRHHSL